MMAVGAAPGMFIIILLFCFNRRRVMELAGLKAATSARSHLDRQAAGPLVICLLTRESTGTCGMTDAVSVAFKKVTAHQKV